MRRKRSLLEAVRDWFSQAPGGGGQLDSVSSVVAARSVSGQVVTTDTAEGLSSVFACVDRIAGAVASMPIRTFQERPDGTKIETHTHPSVGLLTGMYNPECTSRDGIEHQQRSLLLYGNAFAKIERNRSGQAVELWPLRSDLMSVNRDAKRRLCYYYGGQEYVHDPNLPAIMHLHMNSADGITGRSVLRTVRESFGGAIALQSFGNRYFSQGAAIGGTLTTPDDLDPEQENELREKIARFHEGNANAHHMLVLSNGLTYAPIGVPSEDLQFLESRRFARQEISAIFGVPLVLLGDLEKGASFASVEQQMLSFLSYGLEPHLTRWEATLRAALLGARSFEQFGFRFVRQSIMRADAEKRGAFYKTLRDVGAISANEIRELEELSKLPPETGADAYTTSSQVQLLTDVGKPPAPAPAPTPDPSARELDATLDSLERSAKLLFDRMPEPPKDRTN